MNLPGHIPLIVAKRNQHVERIHWGSVVVTDQQGVLVSQLGDANAYVFSRSTLKPFQALPWARDGGPGHFGLTAAELALCCGSHSGEAQHIETVTRLLDKLGRSEADLHCGCHLPIQYGDHNLPPLGSVFDQRHHNCSGKHAGFLGYCALHGHVGDYLSAAHPLQEDIRHTVARLANMAGDQLWAGIDGCSAPNYGLPLSRLAMLWARLATGDSGIDVEHDRALASLASAMRAHPEMVSGTGRCDLAITEASGGDCLAKVGADGVYTLGIRSRGLGVAIKIADGHLGALYATAVSVLLQLGVIARTDRLAPWIDPPITSAKGERIGSQQAIFRLPDPG